MTRCADFVRWLDDGRPAAGADTLRAHAADCPDCAAALRAALELDDALAIESVASAPAGFTAGVMKRVREARAVSAVSRVLPMPLPPALAWWVRAAADPLVALSLLLTAALVWRREALWAFFASVATRLAALSHVTLQVPGAAFTFEAPPVLRVFADPTVLMGLALALAPAALWVSWQLYRWSEHAFQGAGLRRAR